MRTCSTCIPLPDAARGGAARRCSGCALNLYCITNIPCRYRLKISLMHFLAGLPDVCTFSRNHMPCIKLVSLIIGRGRSYRAGPENPSVEISIKRFACAAAARYLKLRYAIHDLQHRAAIFNPANFLRHDMRRYIACKRNVYIGTVAV